MTIEYSGRCVCNAVRFKAIGEPLRVTICHCKWCQRRTGTAFGVEIVFYDNQVQFTGAEISRYRQSPTSPDGGSILGSAASAAVILALHWKPRLECALFRPVRLILPTGYELIVISSGMSMLGRSRNGQSYLLGWKCTSTIFGSRGPPRRSGRFGFRLLRGGILRRALGRRRRKSREEKRLAIGGNTFIIVSSPRDSVSLLLSLRCDTLSAFVHRLPRGDLCIGRGSCAWWRALR
jgi:hypothetical protein